METSVPATKDKARWDERATAVMLEAVATEVEKTGIPGYRSLSTTAWDTIRTTLSRADYDYSKDQVERKLCAIKPLYNAFEELRQEKSGFGWDEDSCTVTADDDVWARLSTHKQAKYKTF